ncbi:MAG: biotin--[acetyl-CoA-carboxylase] ligase [Gemmatimonadetes bacterium]|nr:biotin--[acetyl-CoA-carboxylase] ligase [Gemmatimonadota bacterium]MCY3943412.1 biotin--[acetyl-CoA-carboxylase] ligase [Gemmatimonadota bacterium]
MENWEGRGEAEWAGRLGVPQVELHRRIESTSDRARDVVGCGRERPFVIVAERQSAGRGRRERRWLSDCPRGLWFTVAIESGEAMAPTASLRAGLAAARGIEEAAGLGSVQVMWPNDLMIEGCKIGGVLCEKVGEALLVGVGVNLNHAPGELAAVDQPATSVLAATGRETPRGNALVAIVGELLAGWTDSPSALTSSEIAELSARSELAGRRLRVDGVVGEPSGSARSVRNLSATALAIASDGALEVVDDQGGALRVVAGSVRLEA